MFKDSRSRRRDKDNKKDKRDSKEKKDRYYVRKRYCRFCADPGLKIDYKDAKALTPYITERGRIVPRRITSNCAFHQRQVTTAIKRARILAMVPFTATQVRW